MFWSEVIGWYKGDIMSDDDIMIPSAVQGDKPLKVLLLFSYLLDRLKWREQADVTDQPK